MEELCECPFCGGEAKTMCMDLDSIEEGWQVWGVWCVDDLHAEEHGGYQHGHYIDNYATEAEAIEAWNTRAPYEMDGWFYLPKPKKRLGCYTDRITLDDDGKTVKATSFGDFFAYADAIAEWQNDALNEQIVKRICEVFDPLRKCHETTIDKFFRGCSECGYMWEYMYRIGRRVGPNYCPNCGAEVVSE